jgi:hypothetical protein
MPDVREVLHAAAPDVADLDTHLLLGRARRRRTVASAEKAVGAVLVVALVVLVAAQFGGDGRPRRVITRPAPTTTVPVTTTTSVPVIPYVDPSPSDPALRSELRRCTADDLQFFTARGVPIPSEPTVGIFLAQRAASACALLSYPDVEGQTEDGTWEPIPVYYVDMDPVSSIPWEGVIDPDGPSRLHDLVLRLSTRLPTWYSSGRCPGASITPRHYSSLRLVLREGGGTVELPGVTFDTGGCSTFLTRFGFDSRDGAGVAAGE